MRNEPLAEDDSVIRFSYFGDDLRVLILWGQPWFVLADIGAVIGVEDLAAKSLLLPVDQRGCTLRQRNGMAPGSVIVNRDGLLAMLGWTHATEAIERRAKALRHWLETYDGSLAALAEVQP